MAASLPMTWTATMVTASACVGFTLPGMIEEPGSFSGRVSSPRPQRGPEASQRMSLAILKSEAASDLDRKSTRLNSSHLVITYTDFCLKKDEQQAGQVAAAAKAQLAVQRVTAPDQLRVEAEVL